MLQNIRNIILILDTRQNHRQLFCQLGKTPYFLGGNLGPTLSAKITKTLIRSRSFSLTGKLSFKLFSDIHKIQEILEYYKPLPSRLWQYYSQFNLRLKLSTVFYIRRLHFSLRYVLREISRNDRLNLYAIILIKKHALKI